ncbi:hydrolase [Paraburkholderia monticola]|uniref:Hydrolase n=1 Tax=Paraburkholderia monticola TaxID=1399968 RepID=A0A149PFR6_9BURK|nr:alpha/beta hydrolase [Paraburkholderia monticola]KXU83858.1 hydrolase [Paraburkholderia monticola]
MPTSFKNASLSRGTAGAVAATAVAGAATALWVLYRARKAERDNPPLGGFVEVDGTRLHFIDKGKGPAVVLLHGNTVQLQDFIGCGLIDRLAQHHRVIAFDRPGFGHSERPRDRLWTAQAQAAVIRHALLQLDVTQPVVVGHSWGALVALGLATEFPKDVRGLVLISGYYYPSARMDVALATPVALPLLGDALRYTVSPLTGRVMLRRSVEAMFAPAPMPDRFFDVVPREMLLRPVQIRAAAEDAAFMIPSAAHCCAHYATLKMPVSIFAGDGDKVVAPEAQSVRLHRDLPHSDLTVRPGAGHMVHYALTEEITNAVDRMSAGTDTKKIESSRSVDDVPLTMAD